MAFLGEAARCYRDPSCILSPWFPGSNLGAMVLCVVLARFNHSSNGFSVELFCWLVLEYVI